MKSKFLFLILLVTFCGSLSAQDVPFVPTSPEVVNTMLTLAEVKSNDVVYDLGCGDGRIVVAAARDFGARGIGVDSNPQRIAESKNNAKINNVTDKVEFIEEDLFKADIKDATVVAIYLLNSVNLKLRPKLFSELKPGSRVVSHAFDMDEWEPDNHREVDGRDVYLWIIPENVSGTWDSGTNEKYTAQLEQQFQMLSGTLTAGDKTYSISEGIVTGNKIRLMLSGDDDNKIDFTGNIDGDSLSGNLISENGTEKKITFQRVNGTKQPIEKSVVMEEN